MEQLTYHDTDETVFFEQLDNGLSVYLLQKKGYEKTYATFTTRYGSIDNRFKKGETSWVTNKMPHCSSRCRSSNN